jgi:UDPglucose 6-dehydrogenase
VTAYDPVAVKEAKHSLGDRISYAKDEFGALIDADALMVITEWPEFRSPNFDVVGRLMKQKNIFDGRNIYDAKELEEAGFTYHCIGIRTNHKEPA